MIRDFSIKEMKPQITTDAHRFFLGLNTKFDSRKIRFLSVFICVHLWLIFLFSCSSPPTDLRTFAPAETLVYLETRDLGRALQALTDNKAFQDAAQNKPDFSALEGIQAAIAVTGFEASEKKVTEESAVLDFKPRFVAIADTHAWNWQTLRLTEEKLGNFVNETYGGEVNLEAIDKSGGKFFTWTAQDGRKVFAFVAGSRIFFSNDAGGIEKCLAVSRGEAESLAKSGKNFERSENALAVGFVSSDGVAQISNFAGISTALEATEDDEGRSFIARVLPQILRGSVKEILWTANRTEQGIEDKYSVYLTPETASVVKETLAPGAPTQTNSAEFLPADVSSATRYNLQNLQIAWRSLVLVAGEKTDDLSRKILTEFSGSLFEPYGVAEAETFLSAIGSEIFTAQFDAESEKSIVVAAVKDWEKVKKSVPGINFKSATEKRENAEIWKSEDGEIAAALIENKLILGDAQSVLKCLQARQTGQNFTKNAFYKTFSESTAVAVTFGKDSTEKIVEALGEKKAGNLLVTTVFLTETRLNEKGIERRTVSPFGLLGRIVEQFSQDE
jgi:hypothetical protein